MTPKEETIVKAGSVWFPAAMVVSMILGVVYFTSLVSTERASINGRIDTISENVKQLTINVSQLANAVHNPSRDGYTKQQWIVDCLRAQIINPTWKCPYANNGWETEVR